MSGNKQSVNLYTTYYRAKDKNGLECTERQQELDYCINKNVENKYINNITLFCEDNYVPNKKHKKVKILLNCNRPTFRYFFQYINKKTKDEDINIICNSDIHLDKTIQLVKRYITKSDVYCLLRWSQSKDNHNQFVLKPAPAWSQDTWIWKGKLNTIKYCDFTLGTVGCDNRIAYEFIEAGYRVTNPCKDIKTYHIHKNNSTRTYSREKVDIIPKPYKYLRPGSLNI